MKSRINRDNARKRKCLGYCGKVFDSTGPHNRICSNCQAKQQYAFCPRIRVCAKERSGLPN